ncbi:hypothetical protein IP88_00485 [alpha proteobacterium AAP81b]|nr:hypothetical protein IP88_00485 [alpha proteobacterium AAP81b]
MDEQMTIGVLVASVVLILLTILGDRMRRRHPLGAFGFVPWNALSFAGVVGFLFAAAHLLALMKSPGV